MSVQQTVHVYAVVPRVTRLRKNWRDARGRPLRLIRIGELALVVGEGDIRPDRNRRDLEQHDTLIRQISATLPALLPAQFGFITALDRVRAALEVSERSLLEALRLVHGREQMTTRVRLPSERGIAPAQTPPRTSGEEYLKARAAALHGPYAPPLQDLLKGLSTVVRAEQVEGAHTGNAFICYHLVDRGRSPDYLRIVAAFASTRPTFSITATGPFPPYAFAPRLRLGGALPGRRN